MSCSKSNLKAEILIGSEYVDLKSVIPPGSRIEITADQYCEIYSTLVFEIYIDTYGKGSVAIVSSIQDKPVIITGEYLGTYKLDRLKMTKAEAWGNTRRSTLIGIGDRIK